LLVIARRCDETWGREDRFTQVVCISAHINYSIKANTRYGYINYVIKAQNIGGKQDPNYISCPLDPAFFLDHNPLWAGLESLEIAINMQKINVDLANKTVAFAIAAHLYNAAKQLKSSKDANGRPWIMRWRSI